MTIIRIPSHPTKRQWIPLQPLLPSSIGLTISWPRIQGPPPGAISVWPSFGPHPPNKETMNSALAIAASPPNKGIFKTMEKSRHFCEPTPQALAKTILPRNRQSNQIRFASMYKLRLDLLGRCPAGLEVNPLKNSKVFIPLPAGQGSKPKSYS